MARRKKVEFERVRALRGRLSFHTSQEDPEIDLVMTYECALTAKAVKALGVFGDIYEKDPENNQIYLREFVEISHPFALQNASWEAFVQQGGLQTVADFGQGVVTVKSFKSKRDKKGGSTLEFDLVLPFKDLQALEWVNNQKRDEMAIVKVSANQTSIYEDGDDGAGVDAQGRIPGTEE